MKAQDMAYKSDNNHLLHSDSAELGHFGYQQQLRRTMGGFSSFAISFSLISIITGIFANFGFGLQQVGAGILWSWTLVGIGQFIVALVMADLARQIPLSGYGYQWTSRLLNPHVGYFVGWLLLMQFLTGFPGVCQALASTIHGVLGSAASNDWTVTWITIGVISLIAVIHLFGIRLVSIVNNIGVYSEITGATVITLTLFSLYFIAGKFDFSILVNQTNWHTGQQAGFSAFALSLLMGAWCLTGFEAAADLAEETRQPRKTVPRAVLISQLSAAIGGLLMLLAFVLSIDHFAEVQKSSAPLIHILESKLGPKPMSLVSLIIILSILACGVASMASATRLLFSLARDNMLPFSSILKKIDQTHKAPQNATIVVWISSCAFVLAVRRLELITSISAVAGYLGYTGIMIAAIVSLQRDSTAPKHRWSRIGRYIIRITALVWTIFVVAALTIPANELAGMQETHLPAKSTLFSILLGTAVYFTIIRKRIKKGVAGPPGTK